MGLKLEMANNRHSEWPTSIIIPSLQKLAKIGITIPGWMDIDWNFLKVGLTSIEDI